MSAPKAVLIFLAACYRAAYLLHHKIFLRPDPTLPKKLGHTKLIVVGSYRTGGAGKTPFCIWLAKHLAAQSTGASPKIAILCHNYAYDEILMLKEIFEEKKGESGTSSAPKNIEIIGTGNRHKTVLELLARETPPDAIICDDGLEDSRLTGAVHIILNGENSNAAMNGASGIAGNKGASDFAGRNRSAGKNGAADSVGKERSAGSERSAGNECATTAPAGVECAADAPRRIGQLWPAGIYRSLVQDHAQKNVICLTPREVSFAIGKIVNAAGVELRQTKRDYRQINAACGIGAPRRFLQDLARTGISITDKILLKDHSKNFDKVLARALNKNPKDAFVITHKDACRLGCALRQDPRVFVAYQDISVTANSNSILAHFLFSRD